MCSKGAGVLLKCFCSPLFFVVSFVLDDMHMDGGKIMTIQSMIMMRGLRAVVCVDLVYLSQMIGTVTRC